MRIALVALTAALSLGCSKYEKTAADPSATTPGTASSAAAPGQSAAPGAAAVQAGTLSGSVLETMNSGGYTYMLLKTAEGETWAAVNESKVAVGDSVGILNPMPMDGFESKTLGRKFDHIVFGSLAGAAGSEHPAAGGSEPPTAGGGEPPAAAPPAGMAAQHAAAASGGDVAEKISVPKAEGADARTVAEVWAQRDALKGKPVAVRGKVVKYNSGIMGKNWLHLRDGSGTAEGKDNDLTVTTADTVAKGDVVVVRGIVAVARDFGSGYTYPVIVEDAKVTK